MSLLLLFRPRFGASVARSTWATLVAMPKRDRTRMRRG
jgi:hypothetical protein